MIYVDHLVKTVVMDSEKKKQETFLAYRQMYLLQVTESCCVDPMISLEGINET